MFSELQENRQLKKNKKTIHEQNDKLHKDKNHEIKTREILELNSMTQMKISKETLNKRKK